MSFYNPPKKSLGQNFLIDKNIVRKILKIGNINKDKVILEIGPGYGILTDLLIERSPKRIFAVEKDSKLVTFLNKKFEDKQNIKIINQDILKLLKKNSFGNNVIVFGNLPYNISTKILATLVLLEKWPPWYEKLILMFQKEVADRIIAKYKTKEFSRLSIMSNWRLKVKKHFDISNNCFFPIPKVTSTLLSFEPVMNNKFHLKNPKNLEIVTRALFQNRRKMINKSFNKLFENNSSIFKKLKINLKNRPDELSCETFYKIAIEYEKLFS
jgi:16S rRNA (adenine1518-N6/adenine1519-N6)-dimethyltransferase